MKGIDKSFSGVKVLTPASLDDRAGRGHGAGRPERRRQVDHDQDPDRRLFARRRHDRLSTASRSTFARPPTARRPASPRSTRRSTWRRTARSPRTSFSPASRARIRPGRPPRACAPRRARCCSASTSISMSTARSRISAPRPGRWWRSPAASPRTPGWSSWTSRPPRSTSARSRAVRDDPHAEGRRRRDALHQPPAGRALRDLRPRHDHARRPHGRRQRR